MEIFYRMVPDLLQYIFEPDKRIDTIELTGTHERVKHSTALSCFMAAGK